MELINLVWGAVGFAAGVCFATPILVLSSLYDSYCEEKKSPRVTNRIE